MPTRFQVNIQLKGQDTTVDVNRTTDEFPLHYTASPSSQEAGSGKDSQQTEMIFYGTIPGPYDDPTTPQSQAYFQNNSINDPEAEAALAKAIVEHEKHDFPTLLAEG